MSFKDFCKHVDAMYTEGNALRRRIDELERAIRTTEEEHERLMTQHAAATQKLDEIVIEQNVSILLKPRWVASLIFAAFDGAQSKNTGVASEQSCRNPNF